MRILQQLKKTVGESLRTVVTVVVVLVVVIPAAAWAGHQFDDVSNSHTFHDAIDWMRDNGVTAGCNPPANDRYCPDDFVTRGQMAAFMFRLDNKGVFLPKDGKAANADQLDGKDSTEFLGATERAVDSDKLDGKDSSDFADRLFAVVEADGTLDRGNGATGAQDLVFPGNYQVDFDRDVLDCSYTATIRGKNGSAPGVIVVASFRNDPGPKSVVVTTYDLTGDNERRPFHLQVIC